MGLVLSYPGLVFCIQPTENPRSNRTNTFPDLHNDFRESQLSLTFVSALTLDDLLLITFLQTDCSTTDCCRSSASVFLEEGYCSPPHLQHASKARDLHLHSSHSNSSDGHMQGSRSHEQRKRNSREVTVNCVSGRDARDGKFGESDVA